MINDHIHTSLHNLAPIDILTPHLLKHFSMSSTPNQWRKFSSLSIYLYRALYIVPSMFWQFMITNNARPLWRIYTLCMTNTPIGRVHVFDNFSNVKDLNSQLICVKNKSMNFSFLFHALSEGSKTWDWSAHTTHPWHWITSISHFSPTIWGIAHLMVTLNSQTNIMIVGARIHRNETMESKQIS